MKNARISVVCVSITVLVVVSMSVAAWAAGYQGVNGAPMLDCTGCHGNPPLDDNYRNPATGGFTGNHQTHTVADMCVKCHPAVTSSGHRNGQIQMVRLINNYSSSAAAPAQYNKPLFFNQTSVPTRATCSNVNCHFEKTTPDAWGRAPLQKANAGTDCNYCHNSPPTGNTTSSQGHTTHVAYPQFAGLSNCVNCHTNNYVAANPFQHATSVGSPLGMNAGIQYTTKNITNYLPSKNTLRTVNGKCSTTYCHSNGGPAPATNGFATVAYKTYTSPSFGTTGNGCGICHFAYGSTSRAITNAHPKHISSFAYKCADCHASTVNAADAISSKQNHINNFINVSSAKLPKSQYTSATRTCTTSYCHSNGKGVFASPAPVWTAQNTGACGSCHLVTNVIVPGTAILSSNGHFDHFSSTFGPKFGLAVGACQKCHGAAWSETGATHVDGTVTVSTCTPCHQGTAPAWTATRLSCEACHSTAATVNPSGLLSVITVTAPDMTLSATKGHTQPGFTGTPTCNSCHNPNSAHISGVLGDAVRLTLPNTNAQCASCHNATGKTVARFQNMSTHISVSGGSQDPTFLCKRCHDPHGSSNLSMIRASIKKGVHATATSFTVTYTNRNNGWVDLTTNRGLCQVCHTKTKYYRSGQVETGHYTVDCFACHTHNAKGGAFKPSGSCDACHGYPPVPKTIGLVLRSNIALHNNYSSARFEDYSGGGGAHAVPGHVKAGAMPSEAFANCTPCHNGAQAAHKAVTPIKNNIGNVSVVVDPKLKFNNAKQVWYSGARLVNPGNSTGKCSNVECHFQTSPRWSKDR